MLSIDDLIAGVEAVCGVGGDAWIDEAPRLHQASQQKLPGAVKQVVLPDGSIGYLYQPGSPVADLSITRYPA